MFDVMIIGDLHLGGSLNQGKLLVGSINSRVQDRINLLNICLQKAIDNYITDIIITGDIWESPQPELSLISLFIEWLKDCNVNDINVHIVVGNHDILRIGNNYKLSLDIISEINYNNIHVYKDINTIYINNSSFTFLPFRDRKSLNCSSNEDAVNIIKQYIDYEVESVPKHYNKICIGHFALQGSLYVGDEIDDISNELILPLSLFNKFNYTWMGHVHKYQILSKKPHISHIGSIDISNFGEVDQAKNIILYNSKDASWKEESLPNRKLKKIVVDIPEIEEPQKYLFDLLEKEDIKDCIVRLEINLPQNIKSISKSLIEKKLLEKKCFHIVGIYENKQTILIKKNEKSTLNSKMDITSAIKEYSNLYIDKLLKDQYIELASKIYGELK